MQMLLFILYSIHCKLRIIQNYLMSSFNEEDKKGFNENQFPKDLEEAFRLGAKLSK